MPINAERRSAYITVTQLDRLEIRGARQGRSRVYGSRRIRFRRWVLLGAIEMEKCTLERVMKSRRIFEQESTDRMNGIVCDLIEL